MPRRLTRTIVVPVGDVELVDRRNRAGNSCIVEDDVEPAEALDGFPDGPFRVGLDGGIGDDAQRLRAGAFKLGHHAAGSIGVEIDHHDLCAFGGESACRGAADRRRRRR